MYELSPLKTMPHPFPSVPAIVDYHTAPIPMPYHTPRRLAEDTAGRGRPALPTGILPVAAYGLAPDTPEPEIVAHLFKLYAEKMKWCR